MAPWPHRHSWSPESSISSLSSSSLSSPSPSYGPRQTFGRPSGPLNMQRPWGRYRRGSTPSSRSTSSFSPSDMAIARRPDLRTYHPNAMFPRYFPQDYDPDRWNIGYPGPAAYPRNRAWEHGQQYEDDFGEVDIGYNDQEWAGYHGVRDGYGVGHHYWRGEREALGGGWDFYDYERHGEDRGHNMWGAGDDDGEEWMAEGEVGPYVWRARGRRW
ncbi:hypothetical protein P280DRAFT_515377 [Massarina eburnea CBS 473.64]|uniref:Uncharacterized protein n=1 Tax=Massarina eburnea CBS 473.64 TaxID=1395130 RepID=A0A6A6S5C3_9PLEO|nr:hypothetical protein P280DRAFT_515377 [Massarina eburnea CBS 473.64]